MPTWPPRTTFFSITDAAGKSGLRGDHYIFSDLAVMTDVHQIVDLRASADAGDVQGAAIHGRVGADLDVIFNFQPADLRKLFIPAGLLIAHVAEAVAAEHRAGVNDHAIAESRARIDSDIRIQIDSRVRCFTFGADHAAGADPRILSDVHVFADDHSLFDRHAFASCAEGCTIALGWMPGLPLRARHKKLCRPGKCQPRLGRETSSGLAFCLSGAKSPAITAEAR